MAHAVLQPEYYPRANTWAARGAILQPTDAATDGVWHDLEGFYPFTVSVEGTYSGNCQVCVSNYPTKPDSTWHGSPFGSIIGDNGGNRLIDGPYRWIKVRVLIMSAGAVEAHAFGYAVGLSPR